MLTGGEPLIVAGIDPGVRGALAVLNEFNDCDTVAMPVMGEPKIVDGGAVVRWLADRDANLAVIELAHAMPKQGVVSSFRFGMIYGQLLGALQASLMPYRV